MRGLLEMTLCVAVTVIVLVVGLGVYSAILDYARARQCAADGGTMHGRICVIDQR